MHNASYDRIAYFYNFLVKYASKDYISSLILLKNYFSIAKDQMILDIGGGTGLISKYLKEKGYNVVLSDLSIKMLNRVNDSNIPLFQADASSLPVRDNQFESVLAIDLLHHIVREKQRDILSETYRVLKNGGKVFFI